MCAMKIETHWIDSYVENRFFLLLSLTIIAQPHFIEIIRVYKTE
jgi:hypothetical protein